MDTQKKIFLEFEGDNWFSRNNNALKNSTSTNIIKKYSENTSGRILEIGCSQGNQLNAMKKNMEGFGIDPSQKAIEEGIRKYPDLKLSVGTSDILNFEDDYFDIVVFGFCLYLVDRKLIFKTLSEADRVLKNKAFLAITDFDSPLKIKKKYHHTNGIFSYKQQYEELFLSNPSYTLIEKKSYSHHGSCFNLDYQERVSTAVLYKDVDFAYIEL